MTYDTTLTRVEDYFDRTATKTWERLTSDAPVSRIRATVRKGRDQMRARLLESLPADLTGARILDAGCGAGQMTQELARRGADVVAVDISPSLIEIARARLDDTLASRVTFASGDMLDPAHGRFDHVIAMDSLIYYTDEDIVAAMTRMAPRISNSIAFTVAPRTPLLMTMWNMGKLFPRSDRSPIMIPHAPQKLTRKLAKIGSGARELGRVTSGFYISHAIEVQP
jgi:magnesium-protoporphyrin O-methyltransferase